MFIVQILLVYQQQDQDFQKLRLTIQLQNPVNIPIALESYFHTAVISPKDQVIWVTPAQVDVMLVPAALQSPITELMHCAMCYAAHSGIQLT